MKNIPFVLIYSRIVLAVLIGALALLEIEHKEISIVVLVIIGFLTDVFDGIVARKLKVSSEKLRVWDSNVDQFFWIITILSIFYLNFPFVKSNYLWVVFVVFLELLAYLVSYLKFKKTIATHSLLSKMWTIVLLAFLIDLALNAQSGMIFWCCIILGVVSRVEILVIIMRLKRWGTDIPSIFAVDKINKGIEPKKSIWFNS